MADKQTTVTRGSWSVSCTTGSFIDGAILCVFRPVPGKPKFRYGDHNNKVFANSDLAFQFALEHGYLQIHYRRYFCKHCNKVHSYLTRDCLDLLRAI